MRLSGDTGILLGPSLAELSVCGAPELLRLFLGTNLMAAEEGPHQGVGWIQQCWHREFLIGEAS